MRPLRKSRYCLASDAAGLRRSAPWMRRGELSSSPGRDETGVQRRDSKASGQCGQMPGERCDQWPPTLSSQHAARTSVKIPAGMHWHHGPHEDNWPVLRQCRTAAAQARPFAPCRGSRVPLNASGYRQARAQRSLPHAGRAAPAKAESRSHGARSVSIDPWPRECLLPAQVRGTPAQRLAPRFNSRHELRVVARGISAKKEKAAK